MTAMHRIPLSAVGQAILATVIMLPILLVVILSAPACLITPFLSDSRRKSLASYLQEIHRWHSDSVEYLSRAWQSSTHV